MECGVEIAASELPPKVSPGNHHAGDVGSGGTAILHCSVACRGELPVGRYRSTARLGLPVHADCDPAHQQTRSIAKWGWHEMQNRSRSSSISGQQKMLQ